MPPSLDARRQLDNVTQFESLSDRDRVWICSTARLESHQPGHVLIQEGQQSEHIYVLLTGLLEVVVSRQTGGEEQLKTLSSGEIMGEMSFLDNHLPAATIRVLEPSQILSLPKAALAHKLEQDGDFAARFYQVLAIKLSRQIRTLSNLIISNQAIQGKSLRKVLLVFAILNDNDIAWMIANSKAEKAAPGTVLIQQGQPVPAIYLLLEGALGVYLTSADGSEKEVAKLVKGEMLGEMSFVEVGAASATIKAIDDAWVLSIPQARLAAKLQVDRAFAGRFYRAIAVVLAKRWRDRLVKRGFATFAHHQTQLLSEDIEAEDELGFDASNGTTIAVTRFELMIRQLHN